MMAADSASAELDAIRRLVRPIADRLAAKGHRLYLVGGVVRDLLLAGDEVGESHQINDIDLTTAARPADIREALEPSSKALWTQGERFGTIGADVGGRALEITTHRAEVYDPESRKPVVSFGDDLATDLSRRDFTINAMAIDVEDGQLHDPYGGQADLRDRWLRTPLDPEIAFGDDPLRMLRAARFIPRFDLAVDPALLDAAMAMLDRLDIVSAERIHDELERLLSLPSPRRGLEFLAMSGILSTLVPGLAGRETEALELAAVPASLPVRRAALLWPLGSHEAGQLLKHLRYSSLDQRHTVDLIHATRSMQTQLQSGDSKALDSSWRRAAHRLGADRVDELFELLLIIDEAAGERATVARESLRRLREREDLADFAPPIEGDQIMELLGIAPGRVVGDAVRHLHELWIQRGPLTKEEAIDALGQWWAATQNPQP